MDELVTFIVPVYNAHNTLERCVNSVGSQTYSTLQIILVDDGSTDGSGDLCDALAERDNRIEVIHQENSGVSAARNAGLDRARGEWIAFADSDDHISTYFIEDMFAAAKNGCDMVISRGVSVPQDAADDIRFQRLSYVEYISGRDACMKNFGTDTILFNTCWGKLFKAHLWSGLRFPAGKINEDLFVSHILLYRSKRIAITDSWLYAYVQTTGSIMRREFTTKRLDLLDAWWEGIRVLNEAGETQLAHVAQRTYCSRVFDAWGVCRNYGISEREVLRSLRQRGVEAYRMAKPVRGYIDCSAGMAFVYRIKLLLGRWCMPLYSKLFVRGRTYI